MDSIFCFIHPSIPVHIFVHPNSALVARFFDKTPRLGFFSQNPFDYSIYFFQAGCDCNQTVTYYFKLGCSVIYFELHRSVVQTLRPTNQQPSMALTTMLFLWLQSKFNVPVAVVCYFYYNHLFRTAKWMSNKSTLHCFGLSLPLTVTIYFKQLAQTLSSN